MGFFHNQFEKAGGADIACGAQLRHGLHLLLGLAGAAGEDGAADGVCARFHHGARGHKVVAKAVVHQLARAKTCGINGTGHAPVIGAGTLGLINGAGAGKHARHLRAKDLRVKAAKGRAGALCLLLRQQFVFARDGQLCQGRAVLNLGGVHPGQDMGERRRMRLCMRNLHGQGCHQGGFAGLR